MTDSAAVTTFARHAGGYDDPRRRLVPPFDAFYGTAVDALGLAAHRRGASSTSAPAPGC